MGAKTISISADDITYYILPGSQGELGRDASQADDTIFGQTFKSTFPAILGWTVNGNAIYKGFAGYQGTIKKAGTPTVMTTEATTFVSGKTYQITAAAKRIISRADALTIFDNGVDHTTDVLNVDFLFGKVTFKATYLVTGPVTVTGKYYPTVSVGSIRGFTLTQTAESIDTTDFATAQANGGYKTSQAGLRTVGLELPGVYNASNGLAALLEGRTEIIIELNPDGTGNSGSIARGFFRATQQKQSGNVGALEDESITFALSVPIQNIGPAVDIPFGWSHAANSPIPTAIATALAQWSSQAATYVKYLTDGAAGYKGQGTLTNCTMSATLEGVTTFQIAVTGSGALTSV